MITYDNWDLQTKIPIGYGKPSISYILKKNSKFPSTWGGGDRKKPSKVMHFKTFPR